MTVFKKVSGSFIGRIPDERSGEYTVASRDHFASGTSKLVSVMPSGVKMRSRRNASNGMAETTSTSRPRTSVERL